MDFISLYYFNELSKDLNVTKTASRLFVAQQTLSNHIIRMEKEFNTNFFYRKPRLQLTDAGREMLVFARDVLSRRHEFVNVLADIEGEQHGQIRFGASVTNSRTCLPIALPAFAKEYPNVNISITEFNSAHLQQLLLNGELDMMLSAIDNTLPTLVSQLVMKDKVYLCASETLLKKYYGKKTANIKKKAINGIYVQDLKELPFFIVSPPNILGITTIKCFEKANFSPRIYFSSNNVTLSSTICSNNLAACFISQTNLINSLPTISKEVNIFPLMYNGNQVYHKRYLVHNSKQYLTKYMIRFQELIAQVFVNLSAKDLTKIIK